MTGMVFSYVYLKILIKINNFSCKLNGIYFLREQFTKVFKCSIQGKLLERHCLSSPPPPNTIMVNGTSLLLLLRLPRQVSPSIAFTQVGAPQHHEHGRNPGQKLRVTEVFVALTILKIMQNMKITFFNETNLCVIYSSFNKDAPRSLLNETKKYHDNVFLFS